MQAILGGNAFQSFPSLCAERAVKCPNSVFYVAYFNLSILYVSIRVAFFHCDHTTIFMYYSTTDFKFPVHLTTVVGQGPPGLTFVFSNLPTPSDNAFSSMDCSLIKHCLISCRDNVPVGYSVTCLLEERGLPETV